MTQPKLPDQPTPEQEAPLIAAVLAWIAELRAEVSVGEIVDALTLGSVAGVLQALNRARRLVLDLLPVAEDAGARAIASLDEARRLELRFDIHDPRFLTVVEQIGAHAVTEIDTEAKAAIRKIVGDAYRNGWNPRVFAPAIQATIGLTTRDAGAVARRFNTMIEAGMKPQYAEARAERYADTLGRRRALTISRTETMSAHNEARHQAWLQAQRHGVFAGKRVYEEWLSVQTDPAEICFQLNGTKTPLGSDFDGNYPPQHPNCRCVTVPVLE